MNVKADLALLEKAIRQLVTLLKDSNMQLPRPRHLQPVKRKHKTRAGQPDTSK